MPNDFFEKTVEDLIFENRDVVHLHGLPQFRKTSFRQAYLPSGKKMDIISYDIVAGRLILDLYELKRVAIDTEAICQAYNYFIELLSICSGRFKSVEIQIIMIGRTYTPIPIFQKMNLPFAVYTYDYSFRGGITFKKRQEGKQEYEPNNNFCMGLWAFGEGLYFSDRQPNTIDLAAEYLKSKNALPDFHDRLNLKVENLFSQPIIQQVEIVRTEYLAPKTIKTETFPIQPGWSKQFLQGLPPDEHNFDLDIDISDYEPEPIENDTSDFEEEPLECDNSDLEPDLEDGEGWIPAYVNKEELPIIQANEFINRILAPTQEAQRILNGI